LDRTHVPWGLGAALDKRKKHSPNLTGDPSLYVYRYRKVLNIAVGKGKKLSFDYFHFLDSKMGHPNHQTESKKEGEETGGMQENNVWNSHLEE